MDLQADEELEALRMAALATLKSHSSKKKESESSIPDNISKVSTLITSTSGDQHTYLKKDACDQSQGSVYGHKLSWRNAQSLRRGRSRQFPKGNQRSNLIVITPINLCEKADEKETLPQLVLPQHKWCQSVNEDSSSPKSYRQVGPSRFNRHGSDSESSDESDYNSDNDSYSNDTVLQDEPSEPFSVFTPEENTEDDCRIGKHETTTDCHLSFHSIDSEKKEKETIFNSRKDVYSNTSKVETKTYMGTTKENESWHEKEFSDNLSNKSSINNEHTTKLRKNSPVQLKKSKGSYISVNGGFNSKKDDLSKTQTSFGKESYKYSRRHSEKQIKTDLDHSIRNNSRNKSKNLCEKDLRYELKKRMQDKSLNSIASRSRTDHSVEQNRNPARLRCSNSNDEDNDYTYKHNSNDCRFVDDKSEPQRYSSSENEYSGSPNKHSCLQSDSKKNLKCKRERSHSSDRSYKHSRSQNSELSHSLRRYRESSSSSSSSSSSKSSSTSPRIRLVSSVVKPITRVIESKTHCNDAVLEHHPFPSAESRRGNSNEKQKFLSSAVKSVCESEKHVNIPDAVKRVPVHMRLGTLPHKRIIRMTKDVEAAFVSTSSDEDTDVNMKFKKQNYRVVTELSGNKSDEVSKRHVEKGTCRNVDVFKGRRMKIER